MATLRAVTAVAMEFDIPVQVAVEESMACGIGVCMTCVLPGQVGDDGATRMVRACAEGPAFRGERVRFEDVGTIPFDALGAPGGGARQMAVDMRTFLAHVELANPITTAAQLRLLGARASPVLRPCTGWAP